MLATASLWGGSTLESLWDVVWEPHSTESAPTCLKRAGDVFPEHLSSKGCGHTFGGDVCHGRAWREDSFLSARGQGRFLLSPSRGTHCTRMASACYYLRTDSIRRRGLHAGPDGAFLSARIGEAGSVCCGTFSYKTFQNKAIPVGSWLPAGGCLQGSSFSRSSMVRTLSESSQAKERLSSLLGCIKTCSCPPCRRNPW